RGRWLLHEARERLLLGNYDVAQRKADEAEALDVKWGLFDDTPAKVTAEIRKARPKAVADDPRAEADRLQRELDSMQKQYDRLTTELAALESRIEMRQARLRSLRSALPARKTDRPTTSEFPFAVRFEQGATRFLKGDHISIVEVRGTADTFSPGHLHWIKGTY